MSKIKSFKEFIAESTEEEKVEETLEEAKDYDPELMPVDVIKTLQKVGLFVRIKSVKKSTAGYQVELPIVVIPAKDVKKIASNSKFAGISGSTLLFLG